ncbi:MAG: cation:proton antiporter [Caulobacteraceae bacterium]
MGAFIAVMFIVGGKALPWLLVRIAHTRSRELYTLGVLSIALGIAWLAYAVFGASFALGAFVAGLVLERHAAGPQRRRAVAAPEGRLRRPVLRLGRHAVRSRDTCARAAGGAGRPRRHPGIRRGGRLRGRPAWPRSRVPSRASWPRPCRRSANFPSSWPGSACPWGR